MEFFGIFWKVLEFFGIFWNFLEFFGIFWNFLEFFEIFWNFLEYFGIFWNLSLVSGLTWVIFRRHRWSRIEARRHLPAAATENFFSMVRQTQRHGRARRPFNGIITRAFNPQKENTTFSLLFSWQRKLPSRKTWKKSVL